MRVLFLFLIVLICNGCAPEKTKYQERVRVQANTEDLSQLIWDYTVELEHTMRLRLSDSYVAAGNGETFVRFQFTSQALLEVGPARQMLVDIVEGFLKKLNSSPVAKELLPYPFDACHMEVYINFESFHGRYVDPFFVGWTVLEEGTAYYYAFDLQNRDLDYWHSRIEPYEKSRSYVQFERAAEKHYEMRHPTPRSRLTDERFFYQSAPTPEPAARGQGAVFGEEAYVEGGYVERRDALAPRGLPEARGLPEDRLPPESRRSVRRE